MDVSIYGLFSTENEQIRYIGKTKNLTKRKNSHIREALRNINHRTHKLDWIRSVINNGFDIGIKILETCNISDWERLEKEYINKYRIELNLTNHSDGGLGTTYFENISYDDAKIIARTITEDINNTIKYKKIAHNYGLPKRPKDVYDDRGWISWSDYLGFDFREDLKNYFYTLDELIIICKNNNINSMKKYNEYKKMDDRFPSSVIKYYKIDNCSMIYGKDAPRIKKQKNNVYLSYEECKEFIKINFNIKSCGEWGKMNKKMLPTNIPSHPDRIYKNKGWINWNSFLDVNNIASHLIEFISYQECKEWIKNNFNGKLKSYSDWYNLDKKKFPTYIPRTPYKIYKNDWVSWEDFLNVPKDIKLYLSYKEAKELIKKFNIKSNKEYRNFIKTDNYPINIPRTPEIFFKKTNEWVSWTDYLGTKNIHYNNLNFLSLEDFKKLMKEKNIKKRSEYTKFHKNNKDEYNIPSSVLQFYKKTTWKELIDYNDLYLSYNDCKKLVNDANIISISAYERLTINIENIPKYPNIHYKNVGWIDWSSFLNIEIIATIDKIYLPYEKSCKYLKDNNITSQKSWDEFKKINNIPTNIPRSIEHVYRKKNEWKGWTYIKNL